MVAAPPRTYHRRKLFLGTSCSSSEFCFRMAAAFSGLRDHNSSHYSAPFKKDSAVASTALRQVIGFNPSGNGLPTLDHSVVSSTTFCGPAQRRISGRGPISPRSALKDLLTAAREGTSGHGVKARTWALSEKQREEVPEIKHYADCSSDGDHAQSLEGRRCATAHAGTGLEQAPQSLQQKKAIGFAAVLGELSDESPKCLQNVRISEAIEYSRQHETSPKPSRQKHSGRKSLFLRLATSPATSDQSTEPTLAMDFLNSCYLCRRRLAQERDVFMYNGDKAFCSEECRSQQIVMDERREKGPPAVIRSGSSAVVSYLSNHRQARCKNQTAVAA